MENLMVDNVLVKVNGFNPGIPEIRDYIKDARENCGNSISEINLSENNGIVDIDYIPESINFNRTRRITGYLSSLDNFNDSKKEEVQDRISHI